MLHNIVLSCVFCPVHSANIAAEYSRIDTDKSQDQAEADRAKRMRKLQAMQRAVVRAPSVLTLPVNRKADLGSQSAAQAHPPAQPQARSQAPPQAQAQTAQAAEQHAAAASDARSQLMADLDAALEAVQNQQWDDVLGEGANTGNDETMSEGEQGNGAHEEAEQPDQPQAHEEDEIMIGGEQGDGQNDEAQQEQLQANGEDGHM